jgi:hypothetical protein
VSLHDEPHLKGNLNRAEASGPFQLRWGDLLSGLTRHEVQFVVVGGMAAQLHGASRLARNLDSCPAWRLANFDRLATTLKELDGLLRSAPGAGTSIGEAEVRPSAELLQETPVTQWQTRAGDVDVRLAIPGKHGIPIGFRELAPRGIQITVDEARVIVASLADVIATKTQHSDPDVHQDRAALHELQALQANSASQVPPVS